MKRREFLEAASAFAAGMALLPVAAPAHPAAPPIQGLTLKKFGGAVTVSEEARERQRLPIFERGIERIGRQLAADQINLALSVLQQGSL